MAQGKLKVKSKVPDKKKNKNSKGNLTIQLPLLVYELRKRFAKSTFAILKSKVVCNPGYFEKTFRVSKLTKIAAQT